MEANVAVAAARERSLRTQYLAGFGLLIGIAVIGLFLVKWSPYWARTFQVAVTHTLGASILSGTEAASPAPSLQAALDYAGVYWQRIWQAMLVGLLLAATVESLLPRNWLARVLGSGIVRSSFLGGLLALPGMM